MKRVSEREVVLTALHILSVKDYGISNTELIESLEKLVVPAGEDSNILKSRIDSKFSQKVRNLKSHRTLEKAGLAEQDIQGNWFLTTHGKRYLNSNVGMLLVSKIKG